MNKLISPKKDKIKKGKKRLFLITLTISLVVFFIAAFYNAKEITYYSIESEKINAGNESIIIALIADYHCTNYGKNQHRLVESIKSGNPDLIVFAGDSFHHYGNRSNGYTLISECSKIAPVYFVAGNHELRSPDYSELIGQVRENGAVVLEDDFAELEINGNPIIIAGGYNPNDFKNKSLDEVNELEGYKIMLNHFPENYEIVQDFGFDLMLAGHAHGGQVRLPFLLPDGIYSPGEGKIPRYTGGSYAINENFTLIVSRGLSKRYSAMFRVFNRPELVFITVS